MKLVLIRDQTDIDGTFGRLYINGLFECHTLEDVDRLLEKGGTKIPGETAIPRGEYKVIIDWSNRFKKEMMHVLDVPQFAGIRIHAGNYAGQQTFYKNITKDTLKDVLLSDECIEVV